MERGVLYGVATRSQSPVIVDPFDASLENANLAVFAMAGAGKSYFVKLMALRNLLAGVDFLVVDPEDEYGARVPGGRRPVHAPGQHLGAPPESVRSAARRTRRRRGTDVLAEQVTAVLGLLEVMLARAAAPS